MVLPDAPVDPVLGAPYTAEVIDLGEDYEGPVVATLVRLAAEGPARGAVLHVHGFCDYFFQTETAQFYTGLGYDFYAIDLRKYGRSTLPHQTPNFCLDLAEYYPDLDAALERIRERDGHEDLVISAHSTGGLVASLWAARATQAGRPPARAFVLNSPWLDLQGSFFLRTAGTEAISRLGQRRPYAVVPRSVSGVYGESLHSQYRGEWDYDLTWKPRDGFPVRAGWLRAVRLGHRQIHRGVDVGAPVLTLCSTSSLVVEAWTDAAASADTVLDVKQIAKWSHQLSPHVTVIRVQAALHDVLCSPKEVREGAFESIQRWLAYAVPRAASS